MMMRRSMLALAVALLAGMAGRGEGAFVTSATATGAGGTASFVIVDGGSSSTVNSVVTLTSVAPVDITLVVEGTGNFSLQFRSLTQPSAGVLNQTGQEIAALSIRLIDPPPGVIMVSGNSIPSLPLPNPSFTGPGVFQVSGPPNLLPGQAATIGGLYRVEGGTGPQVVTVRLTPTAVPEPASLAMLGLGLAGIGILARSRRPIA